MRNTAAWTAPAGSYSEFVSVNIAEDGSDDVQITVREKPIVDRAGLTVSVVLGQQQWRELVAQMRRNG